MSDLVVAVFQLTCSSSRNNPAEPLAVGPGALGGGIFSQAFTNQLPHTNQVPIPDLEETTCGKKKIINRGNTLECLFHVLMVTSTNPNIKQSLGSNQTKLLKNITSELFSSEHV